MSLAKIKHHFTPKRIISAVTLALLVVASASGVTRAQSVTQGYGTDEKLQRGMVVGAKKDDPSKVEAINVEQIEQILGIVVNANDSPITISGEQEQVFVATGGRYDVLVSDQNGEIKPGDYVTISSLNGIGMLATYEQSDVLGRAISGFNGKDGLISTSELTDSDGNKRQVNIGKVEMDVAVAKNPLAKNGAATPEWLGRIGQAISGKTLSPARLYISLTLFIISAFIAGAILYAGIKSSIVAIGRNPLSKKSIFRGLLQVVFTSLIVFIIGIFGVYLLLKV